ncbi:pantothenate transporter [Apiospora phragmitis]|uniref:Pantothenate transporter n=1 Tax=Apiospora phragmitis TaxID=2905665 RepID=A0ABR1X7H1_9PEZI
MCKLLLGDPVDHWHPHLPTSLCTFAAAPRTQHELVTDSSVICHRQSQVGIASFMMPATAVQTETWLQPRGWFTDREVAIVVNASSATTYLRTNMHNRQAITPRCRWSSLCDYDLRADGLHPQSPPSEHITLILKSAGFGILTNPLYSFSHIVTLLLLTPLADYVNKRSLVSSIRAWWTMRGGLALSRTYGNNPPILSVLP